MTFRLRNVSQHRYNEKIAPSKVEKEDRQDLEKEIRLIQNEY